MVTSAPPKLEQSAQNSVCRFENRQCTATFDKPTGPNNLIFVSAVIGGGPVSVQGPVGFTLIRTVAIKQVQVSTWYFPAAPSMSSVSITIGDERSIQLRVKEYSGAAQTNVLDQVVVRTDESDRCYTGTTGITAQPDEIVIATIGNAYTTCSQSGFDGGLIRLFENISPQKFWRNYRWYYNDDEDRTRCTHHHLIATVLSTFYLTCYLTSEREWVAILVTFRGGSSGPKQLSSKNQGPVVRACSPGLNGGKAVLYAFGPLTSGTKAVAPPVSSNPIGTAIIQPFNYQYLVGPNGMLIGSGTQFYVQGTDGLYGWNARTSDSDLPRGDGAQRGVDLASARLITFTMNVGKGRDLVELNMATLYRALMIQRDEDWPLIWRHPDSPAKMCFVRPITLPRVRDNTQLQFGNQKFVLRAADPRHYSAVPKHVIVPNGGSVNVTNEGNAPAYPLITVIGPTSGPPVSRVTLINSTGLVTFDVSLTLPSKSVLAGDMQSRVTGAPKSVITLDGVSRYGAWQLPREPFRIDADPLGQLGYNTITLQTVPANAPVVCTLDYRDTWAG